MYLSVHYRMVNIFLGGNTYALLSLSLQAFHHEYSLYITNGRVESEREKGGWGLALKIRGDWTEGCLPRDAIIW
jgi:hypothetical protein